MNAQTKLVHAWVTKAEHDLGTAKITYLHIPEYRDTICFHCQQAVEKLLKAYLIHLGIEFKLKHTLNYLLDLISQYEEIPDEYYDDAEKLEDYAVQIRYPDTTDEPEDADVKEAIQIAEKFRGIILLKLNLPFE